MDLPPWVNSAGDPPSDPDVETRRRLAAIENGIAALGERVDSLATTLEQSVRDAVVHDVEAVAADLRHVVSDLGRLLVRDLGRLSKILADHRDTIVAEVRGQPLPASTSAPTTASSAGSSKTAAPTEPPATSVEAMLAEVDEPGPSSIPVADGSETSGSGGGAAESDGGWRGNRRRRRDN